MRDRETIEVLLEGQRYSRLMSMRAVQDSTDQAIKHLEADYVFPELATKMAEALRKREADNAYAQIKTGQQLAERLTRQHSLDLATFVEANCDFLD